MIAQYNWLCSLTNKRTQQGNLLLADQIIKIAKQRSPHRPSSITGRDEPSRWLLQTHQLGLSPHVTESTMLHPLWTTRGKGGSCSTGSPPPPSPHPRPSPPPSPSALLYALTLGLVFVVRTKADDQHAFPNLLIYRMTLREGLKEVGLLVLGTCGNWYFW